MRQWSNRTRLGTSLVPRTPLAVLERIGGCALRGIAHGMCTVATLTTLAGFSLLRACIGPRWRVFGLFSAMPAGFVTASPARV